MANLADELSDQLKATLSDIMLVAEFANDAANVGILTEIEKYTKKIKDMLETMVVEVQKIEKTRKLSDADKDMFKERVEKFLDSTKQQVDTWKQLLGIF